MTSDLATGQLGISAPLRRSAPAWEQRYAKKLVVSDVLIVLASVFGAQILRFGLTASELQIPLSKQSDLAVTYTLVSALLVLAWLTAMSLWDTRQPTAFGTGPTEYKRVMHATFATFGTYAILAYLMKVQIGRGYLLIALPAGLFLLLVSRWLWRRRLHNRRRAGLNSYRTLVVGERKKIKHVASEILKDTPAGFSLVGAVTLAGTEQDVLPGLSVVADYDGVLEAAERLNVDSLIITSTDDISPQRLREIGWELEARGINLVVTAALTDIAGPRIHMRPVAGLPLIHVDYPEFSGRKFFAKRMFDLVASGFGLILLSPLLLVIALLVKLTSRGPVFFKQDRIGHSGAPFKMWKFRSMVVDAEQQLKGLLDQSEGNGVLFKMKDDPRITRVGAVLRRYSLDELPQLINVFVGNMSLVGPRPPLPREVEQYDRWVHRRLLVKPGITGLWQVSGRSDLSWEDSIRLDLYYVENWSMIGDVVLLWRTGKAVLHPSGAY